MRFLLAAESPPFSPPNEIHHVFLTHTSRRGGEAEKIRTEEKASAGGKVKRHSLLYSGHFIHLVGLIKCHVELLDI